MNEQDERGAFRAIIDEIHEWAVCACIASPEDMAQNFPRIIEITSPDYLAASTSANVAQGAEAVRDRISRALHYPACWDTAAYPTLESAVWEAIACAKLGCSKCEPAHTALTDAARDAARYRWIRAQHEMQEEFEDSEGFVVRETVASAWTVFRPGRTTSLEPVGCIPGELDAAIDAEIERIDRAAQSTIRDPK